MGILYIIWMDDFWEKLDTSRTPFFLEEEKVAEGLPSSQAVRVQRGSLPLSGHDSIWGFGYLVHASLLLSCRTSSSLQALRQEVPALLSMRCLKKVSVPPSPLWVLLQWTRGEEEGTKKEEMQGFRGFLCQILQGRFFFFWGASLVLSFLLSPVISFPQNGPLLGSVGSFDWAGGAFLYTSKDKASFVNTTRVDSDMNDAYLGK